MKIEFPCAIPWYHCRFLFSLQALHCGWCIFEVHCKYISALQSCTGPVQGQNRVFPAKFSTQGKTCFHYRGPLFSLQGPLFSLQGFPCEKTSQGNPCFHYRERVCSVAKLYIPSTLNIDLILWHTVCRKC